MKNRIARKLYQSIQTGEPRDPDWFQDALQSAMDRGVGLDEVIWEAVRELMAEASGRQGQEGESAA